MTLPLRWAPGDKAVVRVTVRADWSPGVYIVVPSSGDRCIVQAADLELPPLVADDPRVVEIVAAARAMVEELVGVPTEHGPRVHRALAPLEGRITCNRTDDRSDWRRVCGDVDLGEAMVVCECGALRSTKRPHGYVSTRGGSDA